MPGSRNLLNTLRKEPMDNVTICDWLQRGLHNCHENIVPVKTVPFAYRQQSALLFNTPLSSSLPILIPVLSTQALQPSSPSDQAIAIACPKVTSSPISSAGRLNTHPISSNPFQGAFTAVSPPGRLRSLDVLIQSWISAAKSFPPSTLNFDQPA